MRVFKNKWFDKFCKKHRISNDDLGVLVESIQAGQIDVDYGSGVIKQRLARKNEGKSGGYRCIILYRIRDKVFFVYGFSKSDRANIDTQEETIFKDLAKEMLGFTDSDLEKLVKKKILIEVDYDNGK